MEDGRWKMEDGRWKMENFGNAGEVKARSRYEFACFEILLNLTDVKKKLILHLNISKNKGSLIMTKRPTKLIGMRIMDFNKLISRGEEIHLQEARLIPFSKPGDEIALMSIFLSAVRLVKEFKTQIFKVIGLSRSSVIRVYTEVEFCLYDKLRIDGMILIIRGKKIVDAVLLEVKNKNNEINPEQIENYLQIAKDYGIPKMLTISNQFVSFPTQSPIQVRVPKQISLFHLSWSYLLTIARILLAKNDNNISDEDQVEIMKEVVAYFESPISGVLGFTQMKLGWVELTQKANTGSSLKFADTCVEETVSSWLQEERDMALILSRELGLLVKSGKPKFKNDLSARESFERKELISQRRLISSLFVEGTASPLEITAYFDRKNISMSTTLSPPLDKKTRGQISWIRNQIRQSKKKNPELFEMLLPELMIEINVKFSRDPIRLPFSEIDEAVEQIGKREIKTFGILYLKFLGRKFESRKVVVKTIESMLIQFYQGIVQYLKKWEKPVPQIKKVSDLDKT